MLPCTDELRESLVLCVLGRSFRKPATRQRGEIFLLLDGPLSKRSPVVPLCVCYFACWPRVCRRFVPSSRESP